MNKKPIGFNGISNLISVIGKKEDSISNNDADEQTTHNEVVSAPQEKKQSSSRSQKCDDKDSPSHFRYNWVIVLVAICLVYIVFYNSQKNNNKYNTTLKVSATPASVQAKPDNVTLKPEIKSETTIKQGLTFIMPQPSTSRILGKEEIQWCLREQVILDTYNAELNTYNSGKEAINRFNALVDRFNSRCSSYKYRSGVLSRAKIAFDTIKNKIKNKALKDFNVVITANAISKDDIFDVQNALKRIGYDVGVADGIMGKRTRSAIKEYQHDSNAYVDGVITLSLLEKLQIR